MLPKIIAVVVPRSEVVLAPFTRAEGVIHGSNIHGRMVGRHVVGVVVVFGLFYNKLLVQFNPRKAVLTGVGSAGSTGSAGQQVSFLSSILSSIFSIQ